MYPNLWIFDTYSIFIFIGIILCFILLFLYGKKNNLKRNYILDIIILGCAAIIIGILSATLFQFIFDSLKSKDLSPSLSMTFFGGLIGGAISFIIGFKYYIKKRYPESDFINDVMIIAPSCITIAHAFGRIGCFMAGCCYGKQTDSIWGVKFPHLAYEVYPTQLFEAGFLILLTIILFILAYKFKNKYTLSIYLIGYGIFRFLIEFIRGDDRGAFLGIFSPSQIISMIIILIGIGLIIYLYKKTHLLSVSNETVE